MKIGVIASEISPFAKTGGLADVVGTLSIALEQLGHKLCLIMPAYRSTLQGGFSFDGRIDGNIRSDFRSSGNGNRSSEPNWDEASMVYLVRADRYFDREFLYGTNQGDYADNVARFVFLTRSALEILRHERVDDHSLP